MLWGAAQRVFLSSHQGDAVGSTTASCCHPPLAQPDCSVRPSWQRPRLSSVSTLPATACLWGAQLPCPQLGVAMVMLATHALSGARQGSAEGSLGPALNWIVLGCGTFLERLL